MNYNLFMTIKPNYCIQLSDEIQAQILWQSLDLRPTNTIPKIK